MGFFSNLVNATPLVGHLKGLYHYARGEEEKGDEAMYQATRTSAVIGGGIVGGPGGAVSAGLATDLLASQLMDEEKGLVKDCKNVGEDLAANRDPTGSIASLGFQLTLDGISGCGGSSGGASSASGKMAGKGMQRGVEQGIQKSVRISSKEAAKMTVRSSARRAATETAHTAFQASTHTALSAARRTECEKRERERERERERREREWREQQQRERERRERERRERERRERERREREWREQQQREREREQREREWRERQQREREWRERQQREREWREQQQREREWREQQQREREWRERQQREREWREQEQREREQEQREREREQREGKQQKSNKQDECKTREQRANTEKQKRDASGSGSGSSQPPGDNKDNNKKDKKENEPSFFEAFMALLERILKTVYGNESEPFSTIFKNLSKGDRKYLLKVLKPLRTSGTLEVVIESVIRIFKLRQHQDVSFLNFLSLLEFSQTYVTEELLERTRISSGTETEETKMKSKERREKIISEIASEKDFVEKQIMLFNKLKTEIEAETASWKTVFPNFRDIYAAVYHYFKHRRVPGSTIILSVKEYYDWIRKFLEELEETKKLTKPEDPKVQDYVHETFVPIFRRRFKVVIKFHGDKTVLSSAYVVTTLHSDDMDKHVIFLMADILLIGSIPIALIFIFTYGFFNTLMLLLSTPLIVFHCIAFIVKLLVNTLLFAFHCFIFILKVVLNILLVFIFISFFLFYPPD